MTTQQDQEKESGTQSTPTTEEGSTKRSTTRKRAQSAGKTATGAASKTRAKATKGQAEKATTPKSPRRRTSKRQETVETVAEEAPKQQTRTLPRLLERFRDEISPSLAKEFGYTTPMRVPRLTKIVLNIGLGEALDNPRAIENAAGDLSLISGQHPVTTRARKSIAGFKLREGMPLGLSVTIRGRRMYEFFDRLISSTLPRIRDFRGVSRKSFDGRGNYTLGIREQVIFPEIDYNSIDRIRGLQVVIVTTARTDVEGLRLLELFGVPFAHAEVEETAA